MKRFLSIFIAFVLLFGTALASSPQRPQHIHHWVDTGDTIQPTCTDEGFVYEACDLCGESRERVLAPLGHYFPNPWTTVIEPTCTDVGREMNTCARKNWPDYMPCGYEWWRDIPALGHDWGDWHVVKEAKDGISGIEERACTRCGETEQQVYYEESPETYAASLSVTIDDPKALYVAGDTVTFTCTLTNTSDIEADTYTGWYNTWNASEVINLMPGHDGHALLKPGESITYKQTYTVDEQAVHVYDSVYQMAGIRLTFAANLSSPEGYMQSADVEIILGTQLLTLFAYSTDWDEDSATFTCELTNSSVFAVNMTGHLYTPEKGSNCYQTDLTGVTIGPGETYEYQVSCPVVWDEEDSDPEGEIITLRADGQTAQNGYQVFSNTFPVHVGYEMGDMELVVDQKEVSVPLNGAYYTEGETIQYEIKLSNCQYYRLYGVTANVIPYDSHDYTVGEAEVMPGAGVLTYSAYHTVTFDDCERGYYENNVYGTWFSDKDDVGGEANEIDGESVVSLCGTGEEAVLLKREISTPPNGEYYVPGDTVEYELTFVNGAEPLSGMGLFDSMFEGGDSHMVAALPDLVPGETFTVSFGYTVTYKDAAEGEIVNMATAHATGEGLDELPYVNSNLISVYAEDEPVEPSEGPLAYPKGVLLRKACLSNCMNGVFFTAGETVSYGITVYNDSGYDMGKISIFDPLSGDAPIKEIPGLKPGENIMATFDYTVTNADVLNGFVDNTAYAVVSYGGGGFLVFSNSVMIVTGTAGYPDDTEELLLEAELQVISVPENTVYYTIGETIYFNAVIVNMSPRPCQITADAVPMSGNAPKISLGTHELGVYESVSIPFQHMVTSADALVGSVTMSLEAFAVYQLPNGADNRTAAASETIPCEKIDPISPTRPGDLTPPDKVDKDEDGIVLIQTLTKLPKNGLSFVAGESIEIDLTLINNSNKRFNSIKCYDILSDNPGFLVGSVNTLTTQPITWHLSYTVTEDDVKLGMVYSDAWAKLGLRGSNKTLVAVNAETMEIPVGEQPKRGLGHVIPGRRPIPGRPGGRKTLVRYTEGMLSADRAAKLLFESLPDETLLPEALKLEETLWETVLMNEYDCLGLDFGSEEARQVLENDRALYSAYLDAYKARLEAFGTEEAALYSLLTNELKDRSSELSYMRLTRDGQREDLETAVFDAALPVEDDAEFELDALNEFSYIKTVSAGKGLRPYALLAQRILEDESRTSAENWNDAARVWAEALDLRYAKLTGASEGNLSSLLAAERAAFLAFADARGKLYALVYPDASVGAQLSAILIEEKTVQLSAGR